MRTRVRIKNESTSEVDVVVGQKLRELRMLAGLSQSDLAATINLTFQQLQKYERGVNRISASKLYLLARHLGVPVSAFFTDLDRSQEADVSNGSSLVDVDAVGDGVGNSGQVGRSREALVLARNFQRIVDPRARAAIKALAEACANFDQEDASVPKRVRTDPFMSMPKTLEPVQRRRRPRGAIWHPTDIIRT